MSYPIAGYGQNLVTWSLRLLGEARHRKTSRSKYWEGNIPWLTVKDMRSRRPADAMDHISEKAVEESSTNIIPEDTVIIATRIGLGKVIRVPYKAAINQDLKALVVPPEIDKGYLEYWFVSKTHYLESIGSGTTVKGIRLEQVRDLDFPLGPPEQQKRIAAKIEEIFSHIDAGIEALKKAKQLLKQYRQSVLKAAVTGELTKAWREANKAKLEPASQLLERILNQRRQKWEEQQLEQFKAKGKIPKGDKWKERYKEPESIFSKNVDLPEGWCLCVLDQLITELKNGISKKPTEESGVAIFRISAVRPMVVNRDDVRFLPKDYKSAGYEIEEGDLLFTRYNGNPEFVGVCGKVRGLQRKTVYPDKLMRARLVNKELVSSDYLELSLNCGISKEFIRSSTKTTAGQSGIAGGDVKKCPVVLPGNEEQSQIANIVDEKLTAIEHLDIEIDLQLSKAEKNKQSILVSAFSGQLVKTHQGSTETIAGEME
jgi:type I restriction enzyme S subunit